MPADGRAAGVSFRKARFRETAGKFGLIACAAADQISQNLFLNAFSRNGPLRMGKRDALQKCVCDAAPVRLDRHCVPAWAE
jgi:hypothetical protein